jgi:LysM repeat protein
MSPQSPAGGSGGAAVPGPEATGEFSAVMNNVWAKLNDRRLDEALRMLTPWRNEPRLSPEQAQQVQQFLDQLAGTVIYSREHWLERQPYRVQTGDTLQKIAQKYQVPAPLLAKINGIEASGFLEPGRELKVVRGPFRAVIDLKKHELSLLLDGRYAGRFPVGVAQDLYQLEGTFRVLSKTKNPTYYYGDNQVIEAGDPNNPLGKHLLGLDNQTAIHGTNDPANIGRANEHGWISLGAGDVADLYDILSVGSQVVIRR